MNIISPLCCAATLAALVTPAFAAEWSTDLEAAKQQAAAENKAVLVAFTGSDWCGPCIELKTTVLDTPEFEAYAKDKFVLVLVDAPRETPIAPELMERNTRIGQKYRVQALPTVLVLSPEGQLVGGFLGGRTDIAQVQSLLNEALLNLTELKAAEALTGDEKLNALYALYCKLPMHIRAPFAEYLAELDTNDVTGIRHEALVTREREDFRRNFDQAVRDRKSNRELIALVDEELKTAQPENRILLLRLKLEIHETLIETVEDIETARQILLQMAEADPLNAAGIRKFIEDKLSDPAQALEQIKAMRGPRR